jgi:hypothetical protein
MRLQKLARKSALLVLMLLLVVLTGCAKSIKLYPIQGTDFYVKDNGDICMSETYFNDVLQAELEEA